MILIKQSEVYAPEYLGRKDVLICSGKIEWIGDDLQNCYENCQVIDGRDKILVPGFIDEHVHITGGGGEGSFHTRAPEATLSAFIRGGITTVVGVLGTDGITRSVENLIAKAKALKEEGISAYACTGSYGYPSVTITGDIKKDIAFIDEILGVKLAISDHRAPNITTDELIRIASDVRTAAMLSGKVGIVVLHMGDDKRGLQPVFDALDQTSIPIKTFRPTHVNRKPELLAQAFEFAKRGGYIDVTTGITGHATMGECLKQAKEKGVPMERITISSDGQGSWSHYDELGNLTAMGVSSLDSLYLQFLELTKQENLTIAEALSFMTSNVAKSLDLYPKKGCILAGADADLLLLRLDLSLDTVVAGGRIMMSESQLQVKGTYES